jgi:hypothetical protein
VRLALYLDLSLDACQRSCAQPLPEFVKQPATGQSECTISFVSREDSQSITRGWIILNINCSQLAGPERPCDEMLGHPTPSESGQQEVEASPEVDKAPKPAAR